MNKQVELFNEVNEMLEYDKDPLGTTWWWCEESLFFGYYPDESTQEGYGYLSPIIVLVTKFPHEVSRIKFIEMVENYIEDCKIGMG